MVLGEKKTTPQRDSRRLISPAHEKDRQRLGAVHLPMINSFILSANVVESDRQQSFVEVLKAYPAIHGVESQQNTCIQNDTSGVNCAMPRSCRNKTCLM